MLEEILGAEIDEAEYKHCKDELLRLEGIAYPNYKEILSKYKDKVVENLDIKPVIEFLWEQCILEIKERQKIISKATDQEQSLALLEMLQEKDGWAFVQFIKALDDNGQEHVANLLAENGPGPSIMMDAHKRILRKNHTLLVKHIMHHDRLLPLMKSKEILTEFNYQRVGAKGTQMEKNIQLLHTIPMTRDECFTLFGEALCETDQHHLAKKLRLCSHGSEIKPLLKREREKLDGDEGPLESPKQNKSS